MLRIAALSRCPAGKRMRSLRTALAIVLWSAPVLAFAQAACSVRADTQTWTPSAIRLAWPGDVPLNGELTPWTSIGRIQLFHACATGLNKRLFGSGAPGTGQNFPGDGATGGDYTIYATGVPGIGAVFRQRDTTPFVVRTSYDAVLFSGTAPTTLGAEHLIKLVKTGDITPGSYTTSPKQMGRHWSLNGTVRSTDVLAWVGAFQLSVDGPPCTLSMTHGSTVDLGDVAPSSLPAVGSSSPSRAFGWTSQCDATLPTLVDATYTSITPVVDASQGLLAVTGGATGIVFEVRRAVGTGNPAGVPVHFGMPYPMGSTSERILGDSLSVRYLRTGDLGPGIANGGITVTLSYR